MAEKKKVTAMDKVKLARDAKRPHLTSRSCTATGS